MKKIRLDIIGMSYSQSQSGAYALILGEVNGKRRLPIIIGGFEAQAIAIELEKMKPSRPLTHDLFKNFADNYNVTVKEVVIDKFQEGIFYAKLYCEQDNNISEIDSRTSDAVALAIRFKCPIYTNEEILSKAGILIDEKPGQKKTQDPKEEKRMTETSYEKYSLKELDELLKKSIEKEEYEKASLIRDEINKRK
ncbi:MAG: DUF151 domain-containing protein [Bacteroidales bacterium]|nr:DUF151 domain-containing protein [Bacteroidales bacterium]